MSRKKLPYRAWIALGANLGSRAETLEKAIARLKLHPDILVVKVSNWIETLPVGGPPNQPRYLNGAAELKTALSARELLTELLRIEQELGRDRSRAERDLPRTVDLDLLLYEHAVIREPDLIVPHPRLHEREFVLLPLADIAPTLKHPALGKTIVELRDALPQ